MSSEIWMIGKTARALKISSERVRQLVAGGKLPALRAAEGRFAFFASDVQKLARERKRQERAAARAARKRARKAAKAGAEVK